MGVAKRPWDRVVFDASETTETSLLTQYYNEIIVNFQREHRRLRKEKHDLLKKNKQWKKKAKELNTWMKEDKEVLVDFYEEIIREENDEKKATRRKTTMHSSISYILSYLNLNRNPKKDFSNPYPARLD
jgi:hypothetical protein